MLLASVAATHDEIASTNARVELLSATPSTTAFSIRNERENDDDDDDERQSVHSVTLDRRESIFPGVSQT